MNIGSIESVLQLIAQLLPVIEGIVGAFGKGPAANSAATAVISAHPTFLAAPDAVKSAAVTLVTNHTAA